jgi:hypothetical protein
MRKRDKLKALAKSKKGSSAAIASLLGASIIAGHLKKKRREKEERRRYYNAILDGIIEFQTQADDEARYQQEAYNQSTYYTDAETSSPNIKKTTGNTYEYVPDYTAQVPTDTEAGKKYHEADQTIDAIKETMSDPEYEDAKNDPDHYMHNVINEQEDAKQEAYVETVQNGEMDYVDQDGNIIDPSSPDHPEYNPNDAPTDPIQNQIDQMQEQADQLLQDAEESDDPDFPPLPDDLVNDISDTEDDLDDEDDVDDDDDDPTTTVFPVTTTIVPDGYVAAESKTNPIEFGPAQDRSDAERERRFRDRQKNPDPVEPTPSTPQEPETPPGDIPRPQDIPPVPDIDPSPGPGPHVPGGGGSKGDYDDPINVKLRQLLYEAQRSARNNPDSPFGPDDFKPTPEDVSDAEDDLNDQEDEEEDDPNDNAGLPGPDGDPGPGGTPGYS